jgi:hypothetical protein
LKSGQIRQKGGAFGAGMAAGMLAPLVMGTLGQILKVSISNSKKYKNVTL